MENLKIQVHEKPFIIIQKQQGILYSARRKGKSLGRSNLLIDTSFLNAVKMRIFHVPECRGNL